MFVNICIHKVLCLFSISRSIQTFRTRTVERSRTVRSSELPDIFQSTILAVMTSSLCIKSENWNFGPVRLLQIETFTFFEIEQKIEVTPVVVIFVIWTCQGCSNSSSCLKTWSLYSNVNQFCNSKGWSLLAGRWSLQNLKSEDKLNGLCTPDGKENNWGKFNFDISHKIQHIAIGQSFCNFQKLWFWIPPNLDTLVTDVGDTLCWWQVWDIGDRFWTSGTAQKKSAMQWLCNQHF